MKDEKPSDVPVWDFESALADTIKEKYESLYVKVIKVEDLSIRDMAKLRQEQKKGE